MPPGASRRQRINASRTIDERQKWQAAIEKQVATLDALGLPGELPFTEHLQHRDGKSLDLDVVGLGELYIAAVGIRPEDMFGIYPVSVHSEIGDVREISVAYRDRPEYQNARERFWERLREIP